jgi:hypothetical protein
VKGWRSSSELVEPYWFWTAWSRSKIRRAHKRDGCVSLPSKRFYASLPHSMRVFASSLRGPKSAILQITRQAQLPVLTWDQLSSV